jgi:hypothetical protein
LGKDSLPAAGALLELASPAVLAGGGSSLDEEQPTARIDTASKSAAVPAPRPNVRCIPCHARRREGAANFALIIAALLVPVTKTPPDHAASPWPEIRERRRQSCQLTGMPVFGVACTGDFAPFYRLLRLGIALKGV